MSEKPMSPGALLAAQRRTKWHDCAVCGKPFVALASAVTCSNACRQKAKYRRERAKRDSKQSDQAG
jgi:predicted nucleic acid-binding Zn ribbon protein